MPSSHWILTKSHLKRAGPVHLLFSAWTPELTSIKQCPAGAPGVCKLGLQDENRRAGCKEMMESDFCWENNGFEMVSSIIFHKESKVLAIKSSGFRKKCLKHFCGGVPLGCLRGGGVWYNIISKVIFPWCGGFLKWGHPGYPKTMGFNTTTMVIHDTGMIWGTPNLGKPHVCFFRASRKS